MWGSCSWHLPEKSVCLIVVVLLQSVLGLQDGIEFPELILRIGETGLERLGRNRSTESEVAQSPQFLQRIRA